MVEPWMTREESEEQPSRVEFDGRCVSLMSESMVLSEGIDASRSHFDSPPPTSAGKLGFPERAFSATGAAFLSAILVNPLDVAKVSNFVIGLYFSSVVTEFGISKVYLGFASVCLLAVLYIDY